jgi:predicted nuclease of predicted toxin-antitoxin system
MRCCCDENIKRSITLLLEQEGHDVVRVQDELGLSTPDSRIISFCTETDRVLLTNDDDFFGFDTHPGVCFLEAQRTPPRDVATVLLRIECHVDDLSGVVWHIPNGWI